MDKFNYRVSVIVPIYNSEEYLRECLNSLLIQTIPQKEMEVLLINDGSIDKSEDICKEYIEIYSNFKLFSKENEGLSATRNFGIKRATGKYIAYLDSDDKYTPSTLENVCNFFDEHYDEIDEVTIPIVRYKKGKSLPLHYRYKYLTKTGVYDLEKQPYISQTTINIFVKNRFETNALFDVTPGFRHEDQAYNNQILMQKKRIGFIKEAEYQYNRDNEGSIISTYMYPFYIFETTMRYYENLFSMNETVSQYIQALFIHDLNWKLCDDKLFPFHYSKEKFEYAIGRIKNLLAKCDYNVIINHPTMNNFHAQYWLNLKPNIYPLVLVKNNLVEIMVNGTSIYKRDYFEIIMHKIRVEKKRLRMLAFVKSPVYNYLNESANVWVVENNCSRRKLDVFISVHSYYKSQFTKTNNFYAFDYSCNTDEIKEFYFEVELDGIVFKTKYWCMPVAVFDVKNGVNQYIRENTLITLRDNRIILNRVTEKEIDEIEHTENQRYKKNIQVFNLREVAIKYRSKHNVWLYYDAYTVKKDNGYYQFINDIKHNSEDHIERYYVITNSDSIDLFSENEKQYLVEFGSEKHKLLYLSCQRVLTAFFGFSPISPFKTESEEAKYLDLIKFKTIYLQHGVLHAALHTYNAVECCRAEQIVVSSNFEVENYINNYNYKKEDLIPTGMARYDHIDRNRKPKNKILYAPSWRKYLTFSKSSSNWTLVCDKLIESEYFVKMMEFINSEKLEEILERQDMILELKLHPIISKDAKKLLNIQNKRVIVAPEEVNVEDYKVFITDFSSYVFDFACLNRPIIYYVTDYLQFKSGMNHYKELDLPFKDAFGPLTITSEDTIKYIEELEKNNFQTEEKYYERMNKFYVSLDNCAERLYRYIQEKDNS